MSSARASILSAAALALLLASAACSGTRAALSRGQTYYEDNQYEQALAIWRALERQQADLSANDFARYAYLRGMTDYRLGFRADARHWLGLAKVAEQRRPGALDSLWLPRLDGALAELERETSGAPAGNADSVQSIEAPAEPVPPGGAGAVPPAPPAPPPSPR